MRNPCETCTHPSLPKPIGKKEFKSEFRRLWVRAFSLPLPKIIFAKRLSKRHRACGRSYAEVDVERAVFYFAPETRWLPKANRTGLLAHEIGHLIKPGTEADADRAALKYLGVEILYDQRWPSSDDGSRKGLQYAKALQ